MTTRTLLLRALLGVWMALAAPLGAWACTGTGDPRVLSVGIQDFPPFIVTTPDALPSGLAIDLWSRVETILIQKRLISSMRFVECVGPKNQIDALLSGELDLIVAPMTITSDRLDVIDFTQQYFMSGMTVAALGDDGIAFGRAMDTLAKTLLQPGAARALLLFLVLNIVLAVLIRFLLWDAKAEAGSRGAGRIWFVFGPLLEAIERTLGLKGISDKTASVAGRMLEIFMALAGAALSAALLGVLTSSFVAALGEADYIPRDNLTNIRVAVVPGTTADVFLQQTYEIDDGSGALACASEAPSGSVGCMHVDTLGEAIEAVDFGLVDVALGDWASMTYYSRTRRFRGRISVQPEVFRNEPFGWGVPEGQDELRRAIDAALIAEMRQPGWRTMVENHLGFGSISPD